MEAGFPDSVRPADVRLELPMVGAGSKSIAFRCWFVARPRYRPVVKVPVEVNPRITALPVRGWQFASLPARCSVNPGAWDDYAFEKECVRRLRPTTRAERAHPGLDSVHKVFHVELDRGCGYPMLFSEPCDMTLTVYAEGHQPWLWQEAARQILNGVDYMCSRGVMHRDLHSDNVLVILHRGPTVLYRITDFGSCALDGSAWRTMRDAGRLLASLASHPWLDALVHSRDEITATGAFHRLLTAVGGRR